MTTLLAHADDLLERPGTNRVHFGSWAVAVRESVMRFRFDCARPGDFSGVIRHRALSDVNFVDMACGKHAAYRDRDSITEADSGLYVLTLQLSGQLWLTQDGRTAVLGPGMFAVYDSSRPAEITASDDYRSTCIRFPKERLGSPQAEPLADLTATAFEYGPGLTAAAWDTVLTLNRNLESMGRRAPLAVRGSMDLVRAMLSAELGGPGGLCSDRPQEVLLREILEYIDAWLGDPGLGPARIASAHHISLRYLHSLFESTEHSVSRWIRTRRIQMCRTDLAEPGLAHLAASAIAGRWGFRSPSHFGQVFKQGTGRTPAEYRALALDRPTLY
ncbi:AraC-like ligand-binding domain-containing protein [Nocardiopsis oceani]